MAKTAEKKKDLMIQKVNLSESILHHWKQHYTRIIETPCHRFLLEVSDIGKQFEVETDGEKRVFSIEGMTEENYIILKEYKTDEVIYWMCKTEFAQFLLKRFNKLTKITESVDKKTKSRVVSFREIHKEYTDNQLYLPNKSMRRKSVEKTEEKAQTGDLDLTGLFQDEIEIPIEEVEEPYNEIEEE